MSSLYKGVKDLLKTSENFSFFLARGHADLTKPNIHMRGLNGIKKVIDATPHLQGRITADTDQSLFIMLNISYLEFDCLEID